MGAIFRPHVAEDKRSDRSARDRQRHRHKIRDSIRHNIADILSEESIIGQDKDKIVKVPIKSLKEYRFVYGDNTPGVAQGNGNSQKGDIVGQDKSGSPDASGEAGDQPGIDAIETDMTVEELIGIMFEDLELPELRQKRLREIESETARRRHGFKKAGIRAHLNKRKTSRNRIKRKVAVSGNRKHGRRDSNEETHLERFPFHDDDMRYHRTTVDTKLESNAVVICIMDTSGSMGTVKKYLARSFYFLLYQFIRLKYQQVELVFISHHTEAKEVVEQEFFHKVESGGTYIPSGYLKALEIIESRYHPTLWNIYAFHCSDGDNFYSDNDKALESANKLCEICNLFGYGEIKPAGTAYYSGSMMDVYKSIQHPNFQAITVEKKEDLWNGLRSFLSKDKVAEGVAAGSHEEASAS